MKKIRFLHISDLHYDEKKSNIQDIYSAFFNDIIKINKEKSIDFIIFSGDLVSSGSKENFNQAYENFIKPLLEKTQLENTNFLFCPGNHDINREKINHLVEDTLRNNLEDNSNRKKLIENIDDKDYSLYTNRIEDFFSFKKKFIDKKDEKFFNNFSSSHIIEKNNVKIGVCCINSSIISNGDDYGKLFICEQQINNTYARIKNCDLKILVMHHPISFINEIERNDIERIIIEKFDILCSGHTHEEEGRKTFYSSEEISIITSTAGSLYSGEITHWKNKDYFHGYSIVELTEDNCIIYSRKYMPKRKCFDKNTETFENGQILYNFSKNKKKYTNINLSILDKTRKLINEKLLSSISDCKAPKNLEDIFVEPLLTIASEREYENKQLYQQSTNNIEHKSLQKITISEILNSKDNFLIFGKKESGKTTLLNYLILNILKENNLDQKIPIFIKFKKISTNKKIEKFIFNYIDELSSINNISLSEIREFLSEGKFIIFIDDIDKNKINELKFLNSIINSNKENKFILTIQDKDLDVNIQSKEISEFTFNKTNINIHSFKNKQAKELILKWQNIDNIDNKQILLITNNIKKIGIPLTPYILSLLFWINDKDRNNFNPVNKAAILEKFFDIILEKLNIENNYYIPIDFKDKLHYLSYIASLLKDKENNMLNKRDIEFYTINYLNKYFIKIDNVSDFINYFLSKGIFIEYDLKIGFKYQSFLEFFIAKKMETEPEFKQKLISESEYFNNIEEIEYYSGIVRNDETLLASISNYLENIKNKIEISNIEDYTIPYKKTIVKTDHLLTNVTKEKSNILDEETEIVEVENIEKKKKSNAILSQSNEWCYFETLRLLSNIFRNSSFVENLELRKEVLQKIIKNYAQILVELSKKLDLFLKEKDLKVKDIEIIILIFSLSLTEILKENIYSAKLQLFLKQELENNRAANNEDLIKNFIFNCLYLDSYYDDSLEIIKKYIHNEKNPLFLDVIQLKLYKYINYQICDEIKINKIRECLNIINNKFINSRMKHYTMSQTAQKIDQNIKNILNTRDENFLKN